MKKIQFFGYVKQEGANTTELFLDNKTNIKEVENYFTSILSENNIDSSNIYNDLISKIEHERLIYPGGIHFCEDDKIISTGCCFDLNDIRTTYNDICRRQDTWLGHDPDTQIEYRDNIVIISDNNIVDNEIIKIEYEKDEIIDLYNKANKDLKDFIDNKLYIYLSNNYPDIANILCKDLRKYLLKNI